MTCCLIELMIFRKKFINSIHVISIWFATRSFFTCLFHVYFKSKMFWWKCVLTYIILCWLMTWKRRRVLNIKLHAQMNFSSLRMNLILYIEKVFIFKYFSCLKSWYVNNSKIFRDHFEIELKSNQFHWTQFFKRVKSWVRFAAIFFAKNCAYFWFFVSRSTILSFTNSMSKREESTLKAIFNKIHNVTTFIVIMRSRQDKVFVVTLNSRKKVFKTRDLKNKTREFICKIIVFKKLCDVIIRCVFCDKFEIDIWTSSNKFAWLCVEIAFELSRLQSWSRSRIMIELNLISNNDDTKKNWSICENHNLIKNIYRRTISKIQWWMCMITKIRTKWTYTQKMIWINRCSFIVKSRILYKQITKKKFSLFKFVSYLIRNVFF